MKLTISQLEKYIDEHGILTGSRAMGYETPASDYDYIMKLVNFEAIFDMLVELDMQWERAGNIGDRSYKHGKGIYFTIGEKKYNVIGLEKKLFRYWKYSLNIMLDLPPKIKANLEDKRKRKVFYRNLVDSFIRLEGGEI